jgi:hypothetical protein
VFRIVYERKLKENSNKPEAIDPSTLFRANLTDTQKSKIKLKSHHTGIYQKLTIKKKDESEELYSWSCCLNEEQNSPGCVQVIQDRNRWNLASFGND